MKGYIYFVDVSRKKGKNFGWNVISWFQDSPIVHVGLCFDLPAGLICFETSPSAFLSRPLSERKSGTDLQIFEIPGDCQIAYEFCRNHIGTPYDYTGIAGLGLLLLCERLFNWGAYPIAWLLKKINPEVDFGPLRLMFVGNPYHMQQFYFCAEISMHALRLQNRELIPEWWVGSSVTARIMHRYVLDKQWKPVSL